MWCFIFPIKKIFNLDLQKLFSLKKLLPPYFTSRPLRPVTATTLSATQKKFNHYIITLCPSSIIITSLSHSLSLSFSLKPRKLSFPFMAENFESFHVPQQNRRNKLRFTSQTSQEEQNPPTLMNPSPSPPFSSLQNPKDHHLMSYHPQGLSLSLSFQLDSQRCNAVSVYGDFLKQNGEITSSFPLGPFTGYATILKSSRFLKPAQQILDDLCGTANYEVLNLSLDFLNESEVIMRESVAFADHIEHRWKNSKLILMLDEVC